MIIFQSHQAAGSRRRNPLFWRGALCLFTLAATLRVAHAEHSPAVGTTRIAAWKDDKQAAFLMEFDDGISNHLSIVIPELQKRKMTGTFYLNPGKSEYQKDQKLWEKMGSANGAVVYGNHTMTHRGVKDMADAEVEIGQPVATIAAIVPGKTPRLMSFARPGVGPGAWNITEEQTAQILAEHHLIERGDFRGHGAMFHQKTADQMLDLADSALDKGGVEYLVFHSVGPGTIPTPVPMFIQFLDGLEARHDRLWITDHISAHKYETERKSAQLQIVEATAQKIRLTLSSPADPQLYDEPLTLITQVPASWKACEVVQGTSKNKVAIANNTVQFEALPNGEPITLQPA